MEGPSVGQAMFCADDGIQPTPLKSSLNETVGEWVAQFVIERMNSSTHECSKYCSTELSEGGLV